MWWVIGAYEDEERLRERELRNQRAPASSLMPLESQEFHDDARIADTLMLAIADGDWHAFEQLVHRYQTTVWRLAVGVLRDVTDAEDIAQETFLKLRDAAPRYVPAGKFRTYLYQTVTRLCLDRLRKRRTCALQETPELPSAAPALVETVHQQERDRLVREAILALPVNQRIAIALRYYEGCGYREIAQALQITEKAAERLLARARQALEVRLAPLLREDY